MKKASKVFKSIRFAKMDPNHDKGPKGSTDDEEHYTVDSQEYQQQVDHVKKRAMQEAKIKVNFKMPKESVAERIAREHAARRKASGLPDPSHYKQMAAQKQREIDAMKEEVENFKSGDFVKDTVHGHTHRVHKVEGNNLVVNKHQGKDSYGTFTNLHKTKARKVATPTNEEVEIDEDLRKWFDKNDPEGGWKRINSKGEAIGPCAREEGEPKPKCMSNEKRASLTKKERAAAVASKRKHDPDAERKGKPINVSNFGKGKISEDMENLEEKNVPTSPEKWAQAKAQAKAKFDVYPSAYANGWAAKKYKSMGGGWKSVSEESEHLEEGRPSQRHPLEGHEYHKKTNAELEYIAKDAHKAAEAMKGHNEKAENKYRDQANDSATVRYFRKKSGTPDWYKKKYNLKESEEHLVHVSDGSKYDDEPHPKDTEHVKNGAKMHGGTYDGASDKGVYFKFKSRDSAQSFKNHVDKAPHKSVYADLHEAKEKTEYDYEGDMARGQLQSVINNAQRVHDMLKDNDNLPEWVQSKITLAEDYISTVANYMMSEIDEEVKDEYARKVDKYLKQKYYSPPFDKPYKISTGGTVTDKSGAKHTPMSRARNLAKNAMKKQMSKVSESVQIDESRKAQIVREAVKKAKEKNKNNDKFEPEPELNSQVQKVDNV